MVAKVGLRPLQTFANFRHARTDFTLALVDLLVWLRHPPIVPEKFLQETFDFCPIIRCIIVLRMKDRVNTLLEARKTLRLPAEAFGQLVGQNLQAVRDRETRRVRWSDADLQVAIPKICGAIQRQVKALILFEHSLRPWMAMLRAARIPDLENETDLSPAQAKREFVRRLKKLERDGLNTLQATPLAMKLWPRLLERAPAIKPEVPVK